MRSDFEPKKNHVEKYSVVHSFAIYVLAANNEYNIAECEDIDNSKIDTYVCSTY